jgi:hypothetical protein
MSLRLPAALGLIVLAFSAALAQPPSRAEPVRTTLYHSDPKHPWNRLHEALFVRVGPDGAAYGKDRLEPLLWNESTYLLDGPTKDLAIARIEAIPRSFQWIPDPVKRAVLQRDLWLVFNWLAHDGQPKDEAFARALARTIKRLALSEKEIRDLPDNYAAAVASGAFAKAYDPAKPDAAYLPPDLFQADGPWVSVGRTDGRTGPQHLREDGTNRFTNSVFLTFLRLPAGRAATVAYLKSVTAFDEPLMIPNTDDASRGSLRFVPNPKLPQLPKGTELALVRRALLIDSGHRVVASPLTETVQIRTMTAEPPAATKQAMNDAVMSGPGPARRVAAMQFFQEFRLERGPLFAGKAGGLRPVGPDETDLKTGFVSHPWDEFDQARERKEKFTEGRQLQPIRGSCHLCHALPGVYSFNSLQDFRSGLSRDGDKLRPLPLAERSITDVSGAVVKWKEGTPASKVLLKLMDN